mgnify:CR=1 FL=1
MLTLGTKDRGSSRQEHAMELGIAVGARLCSSAVDLVHVLELAGLAVDHHVVTEG